MGGPIHAFVNIAPFIGAVSQVRATDGGAVHDEMDTRILPDRPQDTVLDIVQAEGLAIDGDDIHAPGTKGQEPVCNVSDAVDGIVLQDHLDCRCVVKVDPGSKLFIAIERLERRAM